MENPIELTKEIEESLIERGSNQAKAKMTTYIDQMIDLHESNKSVVSALDFLKDLIKNLDRS